MSIGVIASPRVDHLQRWPRGRGLRGHDALGGADTRDILAAHRSSRTRTPLRSEPLPPPPFGSLPFAVVLRLQAHIQAASSRSSRAEGMKPTILRSIRPPALPSLSSHTHPSSHPHQNHFNLILPLTAALLSQKALPNKLEWFCWAEVVAAGGGESAPRALVGRDTASEWGKEE